MELISNDDGDLSGLSVPGVTFQSAKLPNINLSGAYMKETEFKCSDWDYDRIDDEEKPGLCNDLQGADFTGATLKEAQFDYADLRGSTFQRTSLESAEFESSILADSNFEEADMDGIQFKDADLSGKSTILTGAKFGAKHGDKNGERDCAPSDSREDWDWHCPMFSRVNFSRAEMSRTRFHGAQIDFVDFTEANLNQAKFRFDKRHTTIENTCFEGANLTRAEFDRVHFKNLSFANIQFDKTKFENVTFENVFFPEELIGVVRMDEDSRQSLEQGRVDEETLNRISEDEYGLPCTDEWRSRLNQWKEEVNI